MISLNKSFPDRYCVITGDPAKLIKHISEEEYVFHESKNKYIGFIKASEFDSFKNKHLNICAE